jgi:hypothetical protein
VRISIIMVFAACAVALAACEKKGEQAGSAATTESEAVTPPASSSGAEAAAGHAPEGVKPGSYEDWCDEHQVPESMCTRCNPTLVAAFKATGDWCDEHGLPESQCLACNPDLKIVRPAKSDG